MPIKIQKAIFFPFFLQNPTPNGCSLGTRNLELKILLYISSYPFFFAIIPNSLFSFGKNFLQSIAFFLRSCYNKTV